MYVFFAHLRVCIYSKCNATCELAHAYEAISFAMDQVLIMLDYWCRNLKQNGAQSFLKAHFLIFCFAIFSFWKRFQTSIKQKLKKFLVKKASGKEKELAFRKYITPLFELSWIFLMLLWCMDFHADVIGSFDFDFWCVCWETKHFFCLQAKRLVGFSQLRPVSYR